MFHGFLCSVSVCHFLLAQKIELGLKSFWEIASKFWDLVRKNFCPQWFLWQAIMCHVFLCPWALAVRCFMVIVFEQWRNAVIWGRLKTMTLSAAVSVALVYFIGFDVSTVAFIQCFIQSCSNNVFFCSYSAEICGEILKYNLYCLRQPLLDSFRWKYLREKIGIPKKMHQKILDQMSEDFSKTQHKRTLGRFCVL